MKPSSGRVLPSSFRDPSGFLFTRDGTIYRQVNSGSAEDYDHLMRSGLYESLVKSDLLVPHEEIANEEVARPVSYKILRPLPIPFISYPYEWCFSQLKSAALATLRIQKQALRFGMTLKDASSYNIQFSGPQPILIDTLSFEKYREGAPWVAYKQFCEHFACPLALMEYRDIRLQQLLRVYIDGIPVHLASALLPSWTYAKFPLLAHIHLHAKSQRHFEASGHRPSGRDLSWSALLALVDNLERFIGKMKCPDASRHWKDYYGTHSLYSPEELRIKQELIQEFLDTTQPKTLWDVGSNTGLFSRVASSRGIYTISLDMDPLCVEENYLQAASGKEKHLLPLLMDMNNPSPAQGWAHEERMSLLERGPADAALALALVHHLAFGNNLPLPRLADFFRTVCRHLLIEFVPKTDPQAQRLLATRGDIFPDFSQQAFAAAFEQHFRIWRTAKTHDAGRLMYFMSTKSEAP